MSLDALPTFHRSPYDVQLVWIQQFGQSSS
jgi:hypothetical protein